jgi:hypothetical protein
MFWELFYAGLCELTIIFCIIMLFIKRNKDETNINYRDNWLYVGIGCAFIKETIILITIFNKQLLLNPNIRLTVLFLLFAQYDYLISYFTKLRFKVLNKVSDKIYNTITQVLLFLIPFLFVASLMFGTNNLNIDLTPFKENSVLLIYQFPENKTVDNFVEVMMLCYFLISLLSLKPVFKKLKNRKLEITYVLFIVQLLLFYPYTHYSLFQNVISILPLYYCLSTVIISLFYVFLGLFEQRGDIE